MKLFEPRPVPRAARDPEHDAENEKRFSDGTMLPLTLVRRRMTSGQFEPEIIRPRGPAREEPKSCPRQILPSSWKTCVQSLTSPSSASLAEPWPATT